MARSYSQYCPVARSLDLVGDRWVLLIVRELVVADRRFTDLRRALPGVAPNLLADRLRDLEEHALVRRRELPPPAARTVYSVTSAGRRLIPVIQALARFGVAHLPPPDDAEVSPQTAVFGLMIPWHDPSVGAGLDRRYRFDVDGSSFEFRDVGGTLVTADVGGRPDVVLAGSARALAAVRTGSMPLDRAEKGSAIRFSGEPHHIADFKRAFSLTPRADAPESDG